MFIVRFVCFLSIRWEWFLGFVRVCLAVSSRNGRLIATCRRYLNSNSKWFSLVTFSFTFIYISILSSLFHCFHWIPFTCGNEIWSDVNMQGVFFFCFLLKRKWNMILIKCLRMSLVYIIVSHRARAWVLSRFNGNVSDDDAFRVAIPYHFFFLSLCISFVKVNFYK